MYYTEKGKNGGKLGLNVNGNYHCIREEKNKMYEE
jgi:hypothetical protein